MNFDISDYSPDLQEFMREYMWKYAEITMYKGSSYTTSDGQRYVVVETSPAGNVEVKVKTDVLNGTGIIIIPKCNLFR